MKLLPLVTLLLVGCQPAPKPQAHFLPRLPVVKRAPAPTPPQKDDLGGPIRLRLIWDYPPRQLTNVYFRIYNSTNPAGPWSVFANVTNATSYEFNSVERGFFWAEAIDPVTGASSGPNR